MAGMRVAIVGSGLTGLIIAQGLRKNGIHTTVYERDSSLTSHTRDWTLLLHWGLHNLNEILPVDVLESFPDAFCDPFYTIEKPPPLPMLNGITGDTLFHIPSMPMRLISRQRFRAVLSRNVDIRFNKKLSNITESDEGFVTLTYQDGAQENFDMVIGADGANSFVRRHLLGEERAAPIRTPWAISLATFKFHEEERAFYARRPHDVWYMAYSPAGISALAVIDAGSDDNPSDWTFSYLRIWHDYLERPVSGETALQKFKQKCECLCEPYRSAAAWIPEDGTCNIDSLKYWVPVSWDSPNRLVTLAGDAAHALLPFRGQGLNVCIDDAERLVDTLVRIRDGEDRKAVMAAYDRDTVERGRAAVLASLEEGIKKMDFDQLMTSKTASQGFSKDAPKTEEPRMHSVRLKGSKVGAALSRDC